MENNKNWEEKLAKWIRKKNFFLLKKEKEERTTLCQQFFFHFFFLFFFDLFSVIYSVFWQDKKINFKILIAALVSAFFFLFSALQEKIVVFFGYLLYSCTEKRTEGNVDKITDCWITVKVKTK